MKVIDKRLEDLIPYENNPRLNDDAVDGVAESIDRFGFKVPMVIDTDGVIVCGHTRYKAAKKLGLDKVPCVVADDLSDEDIKKFRIIDNKAGEVAKWDLDKLTIEIEDMDLELSDFGFDDVGGGIGRRKRRASRSRVYGSSIGGTQLYSVVF